MRPFPLIVALCGLLPGLAIGWLGVSHDSLSKDSGKSMPPNTRAAARMERVADTRGRSSPPPPADGYRGLFTWLKKTDAAAGLSLLRELERLPTPELKDLLVTSCDSLRTEKLELEGKDHAMALRRFRAAIARIIYQREGPRALEWTDTLVTEDNRQTDLQSAFIGPLAGTSPELANAWLDKVGGYASYFWSKDHLAETMAAAEADGAEEVLRLYGYLDARHRSCAETGFAADFDFAKLKAGGGSKNMPRAAISCWAAKDPDAAWAMMEDGNTSGVTEFHLGLSGAVGEAEAARWISGKLSAIPEDQSARIIPDLVHRYDAAKDASQDALFMASLTRPEDRRLYANTLLGEFAKYGDMGKLPRTRAFLGQFGGESAQADALAAAVPASFHEVDPFAGPDLANESFGKNQLERFELLMDLHQFSQASRDRVLKALTDSQSSLEAGPRDPFAAPGPE